MIRLPLRTTLTDTLLSYTTLFRSEANDPERIQTAEKKNLRIDSFVKWRISDPRLFYVTFGANDRAAVERLTAQIRDALNASVNVRTVKEVVSNERDTIMREILSNVEARAKPLGVQVVDVRLRQTGRAWCRERGWEYG